MAVELELPMVQFCLKIVLCLVPRFFTLVDVEFSRSWFKTLDLISETLLKMMA